MAVPKQKQLYNAIVTYINSQYERSAYSSGSRSSGRQIINELDIKKPDDVYRPNVGVNEQPPTSRSELTT